MIPPINSHFQATIRDAIKINDGMRWIMKLASRGFYMKNNIE